MGTPVLQRQADGSTTLVDLPEDQAQAAFVEGRADLPPGRTVNIVLANGEIKAAPPERVSELLNVYGGRFATGVETQAALDQAEYGSTSAALRTGVESGLSAATLGGSDLLARGLGADVEGMRLRREYNPVASGIGMGVGALAPLLIPGAGEANVARLAAEGAAAAREVSVLGRLGSAAATGVRGLGAGTRAVSAAGDLAAGGARALSIAAGLAGEGRVARVVQAGFEGAARGVVEGAAVGAGQTLSEAALSDNPGLAADHLLMNIGTGALFGGAAGGVLGTGHHALRELGAGVAGRSAQALGSVLSRESLTRGSAIARLEASGLQKAAIKELGGNPVAIAADLERLGIGTGTGVSRVTSIPTPRASLHDAHAIASSTASTISRLETEIAELPATAEAGLRARLTAEVKSAVHDKHLADTVIKGLGSRDLSMTATAKSALREGAEQALNIGALAHVLGSPGGAALGFAAGVAKRVVQREAGAFIPGLEHKALAFVLRAGKEGGEKARHAAHGLVAGGVRHALRSGIPRAVSAANYQKAVDAVRGTQPEAVARHVGNTLPALAEATPQVMAAVVNRVLTSSAYLKSKIPDTDHPAPGTLQPALHAPGVPESAKRKFLQIKKYVDDPQSILDEIREQRLTPEAADVLANVYPDLRREVVSKVMEVIAQSTTTLSYHARIRLGILLNAVTDPSLTPQMINTLQQGFTADAQPDTTPVSQPAARALRATTLKESSSLDALAARRAGVI